MKKSVIVTLLVICSVILSSCSKSPDKGEPDRYYVKYTAKVSTLHITTTTMSFMTENGLDHYTTKGNTFSHEVTIGPVRKGFKASVSYSTNETSAINFNQVAIEVCKNGEPFAQKATGTKSAQYEIDF
ncbi:MAG: hypothetical protein J6W82_04145 [Bacteroidales bacterium]|nr:hypothetical protein [Bacteroidales bacterium]